MRLRRLCPLLAALAVANGLLLLPPLCAGCDGLRRAAQCVAVAGAPVWLGASLPMVVAGVLELRARKAFQVVLACRCA